MFIHIIFIHIYSIQNHKWVLKTEKRQNMHLYTKNQKTCKFMNIFNLGDIILCFRDDCSAKSFCHQFKYYFCRIMCYWYSIAWKIIISLPLFNPRAVFMGWFGETIAPPVICMGAEIFKVTKKNEYFLHIIFHQYACIRNK